MTRDSRSVQWSEKDEAYVAICPELAGVSAFGDTPEEALAELGTVVELTLETYEEKGWPLPE
jgi:predicted RNase H-like HicB family nuclease